MSGIMRGKSQLSTRNPAIFQHPSTRSEYHFLKSLHPFRFLYQPSPKSSEKLMTWFYLPQPHDLETHGFPQVPAASTSSAAKARPKVAAQGPRRRARPSATRRTRRPSCARPWGRCRSTRLGSLGSSETKGFFDENFTIK